MGGRTSAGGGAGGGGAAMTPETGFGVITNMTPAEVRGLSKERQLDALMTGDSLSRGNDPRSAQTREALGGLKPVNGQYVATRDQEGAARRLYDNGKWTKANEREADRIGSLRRNGDDRAHLKEAVKYANSIPWTKAGIQSAFRVANAMENGNDHNAANLIVRNRAVLMANGRTGLKAK